jgi:hypothetical protein
MRKVRQNLGLAFVSNIVLIRVAAGVLAPLDTLPMLLRQPHPILAAPAMSIPIAVPLFERWEGLPFYVFGRDMGVKDSSFNKSGGGETAAHQRSRRSYSRMFRLRSWDELFFGKRPKDATLLSSLRLSVLA